MKLEKDTTLGILDISCHYKYNHVLFYTISRVRREDDVKYDRYVEYVHEIRKGHNSLDIRD